MTLRDNSVSLLMEQPIPPAGYKLVKGEDIKDCVPKRALCWMPRTSNFVNSGRIGRNLADPIDLRNFYAIPASTPAQDLESAEQSITDTAKAIVAGDRAADYGDVNESFGRIAKLWSAYIGTEIKPWDVAQMMILLKVSRAKTSRKADTLVDIAGYAECAGKLN